ncbi:MAG: dethiobiotin synthase [Alphaproteobacteria bacterium]|nr:dethiobiotin synthase [Alphaproteobacteria bacterium]
MSAYFVTATGTDIGKTYVSAALLRAFREAGEKVSALKPIVSGFPGPDPARSDPGVLLTAMAKSPDEAAINAISPWRFSEPLSPDMAAAREGRTIPFDELVAFCRRRIVAHEGLLLVEGVGGVMVPIDDVHTVRDWIVELGIPVLLVAGGYLGTISHTLTALDALASVGLRPHAVIVNDCGGAPVPLEETVATIARFAPHMPIVSMARDGDISALTALLRPL